MAVVSSQRSTLAVSKSPTAGLKSVAGKVLSNPKSTKSARTAAASVLTQKRDSNSGRFVGADASRKR
ncbi:MULTISPECIES: hypothetical protein [unclassified Phenylobacterium]|uniref:hypothetical protein n=1 Tax=unclassified Phenylobacterium TaxID=2640670 RepID=UPI00083AEC74|nr:MULTISPECIES: hypothetical protein [unclassified Phenylobacterium]